TLQLSFSVVRVPAVYAAAATNRSVTSDRAVLNDEGSGIASHVNSATAEPGRIVRDCAVDNLDGTGVAGVKIDPVFDATAAGLTRIAIDGAIHDKQRYAVFSRAADKKDSTCFGVRVVVAYYGVDDSQATLIAGNTAPMFHSSISQNGTIGHIHRPPGI